MTGRAEQGAKAVVTGFDNEAAWVRLEPPDPHLRQPAAAERSVKVGLIAARKIERIVAAPAPGAPPPLPGCIFENALVDDDPLSIDRPFEAENVRMTMGGERWRGDIAGVDHQEAVAFPQPEIAGLGK